MGDPERSPPGLYVGVGKAQALERNRHFDLIPRVGNLSFRLENEVEPHILVIGRNAGVALDTERVRGDEVERLAVAVGVEDHPRIVVLPDRVAVAEVGPDGRRIVLDDVGDVEVFVVVSQVGGDVENLYVVGVGKAQALERNRHFDLIPRVGNLSFRLENEVEPHILVIGRNAGVALDTERVRGDEVERLAVAVGVEDHPRIVVLPDRVAVAEVGPDGRRIVLDDVGDVEVFVVVSQVGGDDPRPQRRRPRSTCCDSHEDG